MRRGSREAFSLIELLIVVAILAVLVGSALPYFQDYLAEANRARAREDLDALRNALQKYEQVEHRYLRGTSLLPLKGRYLQNIPVDPWGAAYMFDGSAGFLATYGADFRPGGRDEDADIIVPANDLGAHDTPIPPVFPIRAQYQGAFGPPRPPPPSGGSVDWTRYREGNKLVLRFSRPVTEVDRSALAGDVLLYDPKLDGASVPLDDPTAFVAGTWRSAADPLFGGAVDGDHRPEEGQLVLRATEDNRGHGGWSVRPDLQVGLVDYSDPSSAPHSLASSWTVDADPPSPLDDGVYGPMVIPMRPAVGPPPVAGSPGVHGLRLEKY